MFKRQAAGDTVEFLLDGTPLQACVGDTIAAAILASDMPVTRQSLVAGSSRAPYCMMGVCFECLVEIDGVGYQQACMQTVSEGISVKRHHISQQEPWS